MATLKNLPTIVFSELPSVEQDRYMQLFIENDVNFAEDEHGYFSAVIRVVNPSQSNKRVEQTFQSRALQPTFSFKQKSVLVNSPKASPQKSKLGAKKAQTRQRTLVTDFQNKQLSGISDLLDEQSSRNFKYNASSKQIKNKPNSKQTSMVNLKNYLRQSKFSNFLELINVTTTTQIRPNTLPINNLIKVIEEIYSQKYTKDLSKLENEFGNYIGDSRALNLQEFLTDFYRAKFKNRRMVEQNAINLCHSLDFFSKEYSAIRVFSKFLSGEYSDDSLSFFLCLRKYIESDLKITLHPRFPGQRIPNNTLNTTLTLRQCSHVLSSVFQDEPELTNAFLNKLQMHFTETNASINLGSFFEICVENYEMVPTMKNTQSMNLSPFHSEKDSMRVISDELTDVQNMQSSSYFNDSEILKSLDLSPMTKETQESSHMYDGGSPRWNKELHDSLSFTPSPQRPNPKDLLEGFRERSLHFMENQLLPNLVDTLCENADVPRKNLRRFNEEVYRFLCDKMQKLINAAFNGDKMKWLKIIDADLGDKAALRYIEQIQKKIREIQRAGDYGQDDIRQICSKFMDNAHVKSDIAEAIGNISCSYA